MTHTTQAPITEQQSSIKQAFVGLQREYNSLQRKLLNQREPLYERLYRSLLV